MLAHVSRHRFPLMAAEAGHDGFGPAVVTPGTPRYVDLVRGFNQRWVGTPDAVAVVSTTEQVVRVVQDAVRAGRRLTVRSGGHCYRDFVYNPDVRVVVDVSQMKQISFDEDRRAIAIEPGATVIEVDHALYERWGVALPGGSCPTVGYGGHIAGGGYGPLSRLFGLVVDHLSAVEVVVVDEDGEARAVVATSEPSDPNRDLWWAHTGGGGGNFGIVTRYWFRTPGATGNDPGRLLPRPPAEILESSVSWPWSQLTQQGFRTLLTNWGAWHVANSAAGTNLASMFSHLLPLHQAAGVVAMVTQIDAAVPNAQQILDDFVTAVNTGVGAPLAVAEHRPLPWLHSTEWPGFFAGNPTFRAEQKSAYMRANFPESQIDAMYRSLTRTDYNWPQALVEMASYGARISAVGADATAMPHRDAVMLLMPLAYWNDAADDARHVAWVRQLYRDMYADTGNVPVPNAVTDGCYVNYADTDLSDPTFNSSGVSWQQLYYKDNYPRLQTVKARWDPTNFFRHGQSIRLPGARSDG
jgi:FAD/FMN-containing dehydrogenase